MTQTYNARGGVASSTQPFYEGERARMMRYPTCDPVALVAGSVTIGRTATTQVAASRTLFGPGSWINTGRYLRIGHSEFGRNVYFSIRGELIDMITGRGNAHWDFWAIVPRR